MCAVTAPWSPDVVAFGPRLNRFRRDIDERVEKALRNEGVAQRLKLTRYAVRYRE
jgi:hypothetical protein